MYINTFYNSIIKSIRTYGLELWQQNKPPNSYKNQAIEIDIPM